MSRFFFLDLETTGLDPAHCKILEVAAVITDNKLNILDQYSAVIETPQAELAKMDEWCQITHYQSGLLEDIKNYGVSLEEVEFELQKLKRRYFPVNRPELSGSSVHFDKRFIEVHMPTFNKELSHRIVDVSSFMVALGNYWGVKVEQRHPSAHRALPDIKDSIHYLKGYLERFRG